MKTLIISGGIGSGKSVVAAIVRKRGIPVYDCDSRAKALYDEVPGLLEALEDRLGGGLRQKGGSLDRPALAGRIFSDSRAREAVEALLYPALLEDFKAWRASRSERLVALESAVILSKPLFDGIGDVIIWVDAPAKIRLSRVRFRDGLSEDAVFSRMRSQEDLSSRADYIIYNEGTLSDLEVQVGNIIDHL